MDQSTPASARTASAPLAPRPRRSAKPFIILALVLSAIALACLVYWLLNRGFAATDDAEIDGDIYTIAPQIAGRVVSVDVADNQHVAAGQTLVQLDNRDQLVALAQARANQAQAVAQLAGATANAAVAAANVEQTAATLAQAQQDYNRYRAVNPHAISQQTLDAATATIRAAKAKYTAIQQQAQSAQASLPPWRSLPPPRPRLKMPGCSSPTPASPPPPPATSPRKPWSPAMWWRPAPG
jgi:membrane fusion protein (multidrug efflux system)